MPQDKFNNIRSQQDDLRNLMKSVQTPVTVKSEIALEDYLGQEKSKTLSAIIVPSLRRHTVEDIIRFKNLEKQLRPAIHVHSEYRRTIYRSTARESYGMLLKGANTHIFGYEVATDDRGYILYDEVENPAHENDPSQPETIKVPRLLNLDKDGNEIPPLDLMDFRHTWGVDRNRPASSRLKVDQFSTNKGNKGVPMYTGRKDNGNRRNRDDQNETNQRGGYGIDWGTIRSGFQHTVEHPILIGVGEGLPEWLEFYEWIPVQASREHEKSSSSEADNLVLDSPVATVIESASNDAFADLDDE